MKLALTALIAAAGALSACADTYAPGAPPAVVAAATAPDACFQTREITNHRIADDRTLYISVNNRDVYRLGMAGACLGSAMSSDPLIIRGQSPSQVVCRPLDLDISITSLGTGSIPHPCITNSLVKLTPDEVAALPPGLRP